MTMNAITYQEIGFFFTGLGAGVALAAALLLYRRITLVARLNQQQEAIDIIGAENKTLKSESQAHREDAIKLQAEKNALQHQSVQHKDDLEKMEQKFKVQFENLANRIFEEKSLKFKSQSQESLGQLLNPLKEKLAEFQKKVDDSFGKQNAEQFSLKEEIKRIVEVNEKMTLQTQGLTSALKGESKVQGDWGEVILEKILEDSGLRRDINYTVQGQSLGLVHPEDGKRQKPDVTVNLPEDKHIVIDSKVSLTHYERFWSETQEDMRPVHLKQFIASVKSQIDELAVRRYQDIYKINPPDFVLMFMPIEGAYVFALQQDRDLQRYAWDRNVVMVGPTNLFATLRTIASLWRLVSQNRNALSIAQQGGALYDTIEGFVKEMQVLGKQLDTVGNTYDKALKKLSGRQGLLGKAEKLKELGIKTSKSLPVDLIEAEGDYGLSDSQMDEDLDRQTGT
ncbi:MAG: DNA recombination protein RmuC [Alphaproteobacteria bacterium]